MPYRLYWENVNNNREFWIRNFYFQIIFGLIKFFQLISILQQPNRHVGYKSSTTQTDGEEVTRDGNWEIRTWSIPTFTGMPNTLGLFISVPCTLLTFSSLYSFPRFFSGYTDYPLNLNTSNLETSAFILKNYYFKLVLGIWRADMWGCVWACVLSIIYMHYLG